MLVGEQLAFTAGENNIQFFDTNCSPTTANSGPYNYIMTLQEHNPQYDAGGDLGMQDVIIVTYDYRPAGATNYERYYFSKEWGWIKWENIDPAGNVVQSSTFNKKNSNVKQPNKAGACLKI